MEAARPERLVRIQMAMEEAVQQAVMEMIPTQAVHLPHPMLPQQITHLSVLWYPWQLFHFWQAAM